MFNSSDVLDVDCAEDQFLKRGAEGLSHAQQAANNSGSFRLLDLAKLLFGATSIFSTVFYA